MNERGPKELEKRQKRLGALQEALSNGINTEIDLQRLQGQANSLHTQIGEIQERRAQVRLPYPLGSTCSIRLKLT